MDDALHALAECSPPWIPISKDEDARYRSIVNQHGAALLERALASPGCRAWLLVRYLPDVPTTVVDASLAVLRRESNEFGELVGEPPDLRSAETWEAQWRSAHSRRPARRRAG